MMTIDMLNERIEALEELLEDFEKWYTSVYGIEQPLVSVASKQDLADDSLR